MTGQDALPERGDYINIREALARVRDNRKLYKRMLGMFMESGEFAALEESLIQKDYAKAADIAHAIKGLTGNLSLTLLYKTSTRLMEELRQGTAAEDTLAEYRAAYAQTRLHTQAVIEEMNDV